MAGIDLNTTTIALPKELSKKIIQNLQQDSAVMKLAEEVELSGLGSIMPVITGDPEPEWVTETGKKPVKRPTLETKTMQPYTLAVIVPFSNQFKRNMPALYNAIVQRLPKALAKKFDKTVFHGAAPGSNFDTLATCTAQSLGSDAYAALVAADGDIADHDGLTNGFVIAPKAKSILLGATDKNGRPLFINNVAEGAVPMILGSRTEQSKAAFKSDVSGDTVGFAGDWTKAMYGISDALSISISDQATLQDGDQIINLWQQNMFAVRCEIECGFVADTTAFNRLTV